MASQTTQFYRWGAVLILCMGLFFGKAFLLGDKRPSPQSPLTINTALQAHIDGWKQKQSTANIYPFNPNYISDYRGYFLEMTPAQIDRLHAHRQAGKWVNTADDFEMVTGVSKAWMDKYVPYFQFPQKQFSSFTKTKEKKISIDLNRADTMAFRQIRGIGPVLSRRIVNYRKRLGGYSVVDQVAEVYGLSPEVSARLQAVSRIVSSPHIVRLDIQTASVEELASIPYLNYKQARAIVAYRTAQQKISIHELEILPELAHVSIERLVLYLF